MTKMHINMSGIRRKIETNIPQNTCTEIKDTLNDIRKGDVKTAFSAYYGGGFHTKKSRKNVSRQLNIIKDKHQSRL